MAMESQPIEPAVKETMNRLASLLDMSMPPGYGFTLLLYKFNNSGIGFMNYISNSDRDDMLTALKELIANFEGRLLDPPDKIQ